MADLLPCPFCGSTDISEWGGYGTQAEITCNDCACERSVQVRDAPGCKDAVWNDKTVRFDEATIARVIEYLRREWNTRRDPAPQALDPTSDKSVAWMVCFVSLNTQRVEFFTDSGAAYKRAHVTGGAAYPLQHVPRPAEAPNEQQTIDRERNRCATICQSWIDTFEGKEINYTSARDYAVDAVSDILDLITEGKPPVARSAATIAAPPACGEPDAVLTAIREACDLLAERTYGNPARSPAHNARVRLETALKLAAPPAIVERADREEAARDLFHREMKGHARWEDMSEPNKNDWREKANALAALHPASGGVAEALSLPVKADFTCDEDEDRYSVRWINAFRSVSLVVNEDGRIVLVESTVAPPRSRILASTSVAALAASHVSGEAAAAAEPDAVREKTARDLYEAQHIDHRRGPDGLPIAWADLASFCKELHYEAADALLARNDRQSGEQRS